MSNVEYFQQRAGDERERAKACDDPKIAAIHDKLAESYEELSYGKIEYSGFSQTG